MGSFRELVGAGDDGLGAGVSWRQRRCWLVVSCVSGIIDSSIFSS